MHSIHPPFTANPSLKIPAGYTPHGFSLGSSTNNLPLPALNSYETFSAPRDFPGLSGNNTFSFQHLFNFLTPTSVTDLTAFTTVIAVTNAFSDNYAQAPATATIHHASLNNFIPHLQTTTSPSLKSSELPPKSSTFTLTNSLKF